MFLIKQEKIYTFCKNTPIDVLEL